jgi:hypothetical protein
VRIQLLGDLPAALARPIKTSSTHFLLRDPPANSAVPPIPGCRHAAPSQQPPFELPHHLYFPSQCRPLRFPSRRCSTTKTIAIKIHSCWPSFLSPGPLSSCHDPTYKTLLHLAPPPPCPKPHLNPLVHPPNLLPIEDIGSPLLFVTTRPSHATLPSSITVVRLHLLPSMFWCFHSELPRPKPPAHAPLASRATRAAARSMVDRCTTPPFWSMATMNLVHGISFTQIIFESRLDPKSL